MAIYPGSGTYFGNEAEFLGSGYSYCNSVSALDTSKFIVAYCDCGDNYHGTAKVGTVSGTTITFDDEAEFSTTTSPTYHNLYIATDSLDDSKFVVAHTYEDDPEVRSAAIIGTVSGTTISFGNEEKFLPVDGAQYISVAALNSSKFVTIYKEYGDTPATTNHGYATIGVVSGTAISFGNRTEFCDFCANTSVARLTNSKFVMLYRYDGGPDPYRGYARIGTVDDTTITFGSGVKFLVPGSVNYISVAALTDSKFVIVYRDTVDSNHGTAKIGTVDGTTITFGNEVEFVNVDGEQWNSVVALDDSTFAVAYTDTSDNNHGTIKIGTVDDTIITFSDETEFTTPSGAAHISMTKLDASKVAVVYCDSGDNSYGKAKIGIIGLDIPTSDFYINGHINTISSGNLFTTGIDLSIASGNLYINGPTQSTISCDLFIVGPQKITTSSDFYIYNSIMISGGCNLFIYGSNSPSLFTYGSESIFKSGNMYVGGIVTLPSLSGIQSFDWLLKTSDYYPQIIGMFDASASSVNIQVWDITNGHNVLVTIVDSGCYVIGNTDRWGWSTVNLPAISGYTKHYFYRMTSDINETFDGQFIFDVPEGAKWIHPNNMDDYVLRI